MAKKCSRCEEVKSLEEFYNNRSTRDGVTSECKVCNKAARRGYHQGLSDRHVNYMLQWRFGVSLAWYDETLVSQGGGCAICGKTPEENGKRLCVDHCHATLKVRGLLCSNCNHGLGQFKDDTSLLENAINYLKSKD